MAGNGARRAPRLVTGRPRAAGSSGEGARRARLLTGWLRTTTVLRFTVGATAGVVLPLVLAVMWQAPGGGATWPGVAVATMALVGVVAGELLERSLFFTSASPPR